MFFWMQEPEKDKDAEMLVRCNKAVKGASWQPPGTPAVGAPVVPAAATQPGQSAPVTGQPAMSNQELQAQILRCASFTLRLATVSITTQHSACTGDP